MNLDRLKRLTFESSIHNLKWMYCIGRIIIVLDFLFIYAKEKLFSQQRNLCSFFMNKNSLESCIHVTLLNFQSNRILFTWTGQVKKEDFQSIFRLF